MNRLFKTEEHFTKLQFSGFVFMKSVVWTRARFLAAALALAFGLAPVQWLPGASARLRDAMLRDYPNRADYDRMEHGYYEPLLDSARKLSVLDASGTRHEGPAFDAGPLALAVNDLREYVLKPSLSTRHTGKRWTTNALGMRDREYSFEKPSDTFRIALVGDSIGSGWGVDDGDGFEPLLERRLDELSRAGGGPKVEILNFAVPGHAPGQRWEHYRRSAVGRGIDMVIYEATLADPGWDERRLRSVLNRGLSDALEAPQYGACAPAGRGEVGREPGRISAHSQALQMANPRGRLPDDRGRLPRLGRSVRLGVDSQGGQDRRAARPREAEVACQAQRLLGGAGRLRRLRRRRRDRISHRPDGLSSQSHRA